MNGPAVDLAATVGSVALRNPVMTASGTAGYGSEFAPFFDLASIGAVVTKSIAHFEWAGNPAPRVHPAAGPPQESSSLIRSLRNL